MKLALLVTLVTLIISLVIVQNIQARGNPKIVCEESTYNFGELHNTKTVKHTFVLRNKGNAPLVISSVRASCGCTTTNISNKTIVPGEETNLDAELSLRGFKGHVKKDIKVMSNDPEQSLLTLVIEGTATEDIKIEPNTVSFGHIAEGTSATKTVNITNTNDKPFKITKIESDSTYYDIEIETVEDGKFYQLHINLKPQSSKKNILDNIYVFTDNPDYQKIEIPVSANVFGLFTIIPEEIVIETNTNQPDMQYTIIVYSTNNKPFQIKSITAPTPSIQTKVLPLELNGYSVLISNIESTKKLDGKNLLITTDLEEKKEILIPFRITSSEK